MAKNAHIRTHPAAARKDYLDAVAAPEDPHDRPTEGDLAISRVPVSCPRARAERRRHNSTVTDHRYLLNQYFQAIEDNST